MVKLMFFLNKSYLLSHIIVIRLILRTGASLPIMQIPITVLSCGWLGWAMVLGSSQCRGVLLLLHIVGQGSAVLAAGAGRVGYIFIFFICFPFLNPFFWETAEYDCNIVVLVIKS